MHYYQEKLNSGKKLKSTADVTLEIEDDVIIYRGVFYTDFKKNDAPDGVTFKHDLYINKLNGEFVIMYEIINKKTTGGKSKSNSWVKNNNFDKLENLTYMGFYRGEKRSKFWGVKYDRKTLEIFNVIKKDLQSEMDDSYLKKKSYYKPQVNKLYDLIVDFHLYKKKIKGHDNVYQNIQSIFPKKKWLKANDNKFLPAMLDEFGLKSKYLIKKLSIKESTGKSINIRAVIYLCKLFGENYLDHIKKFDWLQICRTINFNKRKSHMCKTDIEKNGLVGVFIEQVKLGGRVGNVNDPPRVHNILLSLYKLIEVRDLLEEKGYVLKLKLKTPEDIELLLPYWDVIKKSATVGHVLKYTIPQDVLDDLEAPIKGFKNTSHPRVLLTDNDFSFEGYEMKNCMAKQFTHGAIYIYISLAVGKKKIDLQYQRGKLQQSYGKANSPVPMEIFGEGITELNQRMLKYSTLTWTKEKIQLPPIPF